MWAGLLLLASLAAVDVLGHQPRRPASSPTLRYVALVTRHGSRSPLSTFPTDPYPYTDRTFWPDGPGQLTNVGKTELYTLGKRIRSRYQNFLSPLYFPNDTKVEYNPYDRDFNSGACLLAGLYPPVGPALWSNKVLWQPIPMAVRSFDVCDIDSEKICPAFKKESDSLLNMLNEKSSSYKELLQYVSTNTGKNISKVTELYDIYDTLLMQKRNGYKQPAWAESVLPKLQPLAADTLLVEYAGSDKLVSLGAGPELEHLADLLTAKAEGSAPSNARLFVEAAHDCTLLALLTALGVNDSSLEIHTGGHLVLELHEVPPSYIVQALYFREPTDNSPQLLNITRCPSPCSLRDFNNMVDSINPPDLSKACNS